MITGASLNVLDYGADSTGVADSTLGIQAALTNAPSYSTIDFAGGTYKTTAALIVPVGTIGLVIQGNGATINCAHNGDGLVLNSTNQNYSRHKVYDLRIKGPNVSFPANAVELAGTSTGAGIKIGPNDTTNTCTAYLCTFINCRVENFYWGVYMQNALMCQFIGGNAFYNQYGVYIDGGQTNANNFNGFTIRENRVQGIKSSGRTGGSLSNATHNTWFGCEIETNIPYNLAAAAGGYPTSFDSTGVGTGIMLSNSYGFVFDGCYMENHNYSAWIDTGSDQNQFINMRFAPGGAANVRVAGVAIKGTSANNNVFQSCRMIASDVTTANVLMDNAGQMNNQFLDCDGFNFVGLTGVPDVRNNKSYNGGGTVISNIAAPATGRLNAFQGTGRAALSGSTGSVTLNAQGLAEVAISSGSGLTGNITITSFTNLTNNSLFVLQMTQSTWTTTVQSGSMGTGALILLKSATNATMTVSGNMIAFWVNGLGTAIEIGRNF